jgi:hypothetical protein
MGHHTLLHGNFHVFLLRIDEDLAAKIQAAGCRRCATSCIRTAISANRVAVA